MWIFINHDRIWISYVGLSGFKTTSDRSRSGTDTVNDQDASSLSIVCPERDEQRWTGKETDRNMTIPDLLKDIDERDNKRNELRCQNSTLLLGHDSTVERNQRHACASIESFKCSNRKRKKSKEKLVRVLCFVGWIFCCPCWTLGICLREHPESEEDLQEDPCWPCFTKTFLEQPPN